MEITQDLLVWKLSLTPKEEKYWRTVCEKTVEENFRCDGDKIIGIRENYSVRIFTIRTVQKMLSGLFENEIGQRYTAGYFYTYEECEVYRSARVVVLEFYFVLTLPEFTYQYVAHLSAHD